MKLAFSTLGCPDWDIPTIVKRAVEFGVDGVELRGGPKGHISPAASKDRRREVRARFADAGIEAACVTAYTKLSSPNEKTRADHVEDMKRYVELAEDLGSPNVRTFFGAFPWYVAREDVYDYAAEMLERVIPVLETVRVLVETHDAVSAAEDLRPLFDRVSSERVGALWDMAHSYREGESIERSWELIGGRVHHVHVKDEYPIEERKLEHRVPGEGIVPLAEVRDLLGAEGFTGAVCLEWERAHHPEMPPLEEGLRAFVEIFRGGGR